MSYDDEWPEESANLRRQVIRETIRPATLEEFRNLGEKCFPSKNHPWFGRHIEFPDDHRALAFTARKCPMPG